MSPPAPRLKRLNSRGRSHSVVAVCSPAGIEMDPIPTPPALTDRGCLAPLITQRMKTALRFALVAGDAAVKPEQDAVNRSLKEVPQPISLCKRERRGVPIEKHKHHALG